MANLAAASQLLDTPLVTVGAGPYEAGIYAFMWTLMLLGDASGDFSGAALARGREVGPSLLQQMQMHFPEDVGLVERTLLPLCSGSASASSGGRVRVSPSSCWVPWRMKRSMTRRFRSSLMPRRP